MKFVEENNEKMFTKNMGKDIIRKKYNFFTANNKKYLQRKGLLMKETNDIIKDIVLELSKKYNKKEKMVQIMFEKCNCLGYNIKESKEIIIDFLKYN